MSLFISHGAPTLLLDPTPAHHHLKALGQALPAPRAVILVSAHWQSRELQVGNARHHHLIYDFSGFPQALYDFSWPAAGDPALAEAIQSRLNAEGLPARLDPKRGLDHGAWVPMALMDPDASVPVVPVSLPLSCPADGLWRIGQTLAGFEAEGYRLIGSGSLTHNLRRLAPAWNAPEQVRLDPFLEAVRGIIEQDDRQQLLAWATLPDALWHHPSPEHILPLIVAAAAPGPARSLHQSVEYGVLAMDCWAFG